MKKILIVICILCMCACSSSKKVEEDTGTINENLDKQVTAKEDDILKEVVGNWYFWEYEKTHFANIDARRIIPNSITFNDDSTFEYELYVWDSSLTESKTQKIQGTYSISNNKISMIYKQKYNGGFENEDAIEDKIDANFSLIGNEITIEGFGIYVKEGQTLNPLPDCSNEYSKELEGYYICTYINGEGNDYFYFNEKGQINRIAYFNSEQNCEYDYVYNKITSNTINGMVERCGGDSECSFEANYVINEDGSVDLFNSAEEQYDSNGKQFGTLTKISKDTFEEVQKITAYYIGDVYFIKADALNVREKPSISSKMVSILKKGDIRYASYEPEEDPVQADGYTWYFIGEKQWIADKNGEWVKKIR